MDPWETKSGNKYLITCIDYATRWIIAKPVKDMTEGAVAKFLYELMMTYGAPFEIISDRVEDVTVGMSISPSTFSLKDSHTCSHRILTILSIIWNTPPTAQDETPPRESQAPLDEIEEMEERSEFIARNLEEVGQARSAANVRTKAQAEAMRKRNNFDEDTPDYYFKVGDMVKLKHHDRLKLEFKWKGPYHIVDVGHPGTYWIMTPQGTRYPNSINQNDLAPWLAPVVDNIDFFYDGTKTRNSDI
ncbi:hypothetical protein BASA81_009237 [Batrachochytrium salamandrivorans]|nr:hypothetical protein BASA81_009237 [Batrachochytrium salamandrivorans]